MGTPGVNIDEASGLRRTIQHDRRAGIWMNSRDECDGGDDYHVAPFQALGPIHRVGRIVRAVPSDNIGLVVRVRG